MSIVRHDKEIKDLIKRVEKLEKDQKPKKAPVKK